VYLFDVFASCKGRGILKSVNELLCKTIVDSQANELESEILRVKDVNVKEKIRI